MDEITKDEILKHYGYDPRVYLNMGCGLWTRDKVFERIPFLKSYMDCAGYKKIRVTLDFDPDYERAIFRVEHIPNPTESLEKSMQEFETMYDKMLKRKRRYGFALSNNNNQDS